MNDAICSAVGALLCERISRKVIPWDWFLAPHHRGWKRAWAEIREKCDQAGMSWQYMETSSNGHHFRQRTSDGGPNRWYMVARQPDDFEPAEPGAA
jgi:hypothetical protein